MNCAEFRERFPEHFFQEPGGQEPPEVQAHLAACVACREEAERLRALWTSLGHLSEEKPDEALRDRFVSMLEGYRQGLGCARLVPWPEHLGDWLLGLIRQPAFAVGLAALFLGLGLVAGNLLALRESGARRELAQLREEVVNMRRMVTLALLQQQSAGERLEGVSWSRRVGHPDPEVLSALLQVLRYDPNVNVRLAALDALRPFAREAAVRQGLLLALEQQQASPLVQLSLIDFVVDAREAQAAPVLKQMSRSDKLLPPVRERAAWALAQLSSGGSL